MYLEFFYILTWLVRRKSLIKVAVTVLPLVILYTLSFHKIIEAELSEILKIS